MLTNFVMILLFNPYLFLIKGLPGYALVVNAISASFLASSNRNCRSEWLEIFDGNKPYTIVPRYVTNYVIHSLKCCIVKVRGR